MTATAAADAGEGEGVMTAVTATAAATAVGVPMVGSNEVVIGMKSEKRKWKEYTL
jgi:hypothetical protein